MDTEQIQQQMRVQRATIDAKLDLLTDRASRARRRSVPALLTVLGILTAAIVWARTRSARGVLHSHSKVRPRVRTAG
jgi:hypothetical protein